MRKKVGPKDIIGKREGLRITEPEKNENEDKQNGCSIIEINFRHKYSIRIAHL